jgi:chitinase
VVEGFTRDAENFKLLADLRRQHPHLRILISVGGWTWSNNFSDAALTAESRRRFTESAIEFVRRHDIDGVDIDWEYPGPARQRQRAPSGGQGELHRDDDGLRQALDAEGRARNRRYLLTFAAGAFPDFIAKTEMDKVQAVVDFVNLMTYDFRTSDPIAGHHANLYLHPADTKQRSVDSAVRDFIAAGVPPGKVVVGVPFLRPRVGRHQRGRHRPYQPGSRPTERIDHELRTDVDGARRSRRLRTDVGQPGAGPYLWNKDTRTFISYEDPESLGLKSAYIREKGLGGASVLGILLRPDRAVARHAVHELARSEASRHRAPVWTGIALSRARRAPVSRSEMSRSGACIRGPVRTHASSVGIRSALPLTLGRVSGARQLPHAAAPKQPAIRIARRQDRVGYWGA